MARYRYSVWRSHRGWMADIRDYYRQDVDLLGPLKTEAAARAAARSRISKIGDGRHVVTEES
jgi:hypothetical protein